MLDHTRLGVAPGNLPPPLAPDLMSTPAADTLVGGRYVLERELGGGGCAIVWAARHADLGKPVAIKRLRAELARNPVHAQRFVREAQLASRLSHEHIVSIIDFGRDDGTGVPYLVMERLDGPTLADVIRTHGVLPWSRAVTLLLQLTRALRCAHESGVLHRDLKPQNTMLVTSSAGGELVKLCDFGLSRLCDDDDRLTVTGSFIGTPAYMAPEQIEGAAQDERCDLYALGVTAYEMLTGELPYRARSPVALLAEILDPVRRSVGQHDPSRDAPAALVALIDQCIMRDPARRPASAVEIERALLDISAGRTEVAADLTGRRIGSYEVLERIGEGGSGSVWLACHATIGTHVAIKVLRPEVAALPGVAQRFVNEARAACSIDSPYIARFVDLGELPGAQPYAIMEYVRGETLHELVQRRGTLRPTEVCELGAQLAQALTAAHAIDIVHRDLKPANIIVTSEYGKRSVKLLDFGIAKLGTASGIAAPMTEAGLFMGTVTHCAPEQLLGGALGPAVDIYALGSTLFEALTGSAPFVGDATAIAMAKHSRPARSVGTVAPGAPASLAVLVDAMLSSTPSARPTAAAVARTLAGGVPAATPVPARRGRRLAAVCLVAVAFALGFLAVRSLTSDDASLAATPAMHIQRHEPAPTPVISNVAHEAPAPAALLPAQVTAPASPPSRRPRAERPRRPAKPAEAAPRTDVLIADPFAKDPR